MIIVMQISKHERERERERERGGERRELLRVHELRHAYQKGSVDLNLTNNCLPNDYCLSFLTFQYSLIFIYSKN